MYITVDCSQLRDFGKCEDGVYSIAPGGGATFHKVYCEFTDLYVWTRLLYRADGVQSFHQDWNAYSSGFGNAAEDHWLGNTWINLLTTSKPHRLHVDIWYPSIGYFYADYEHFSVSDANDLFRLSVSGYSGDAGDGLGDESTAIDGFVSDGAPFSTYDVDNDNNPGNCAYYFYGAWWHNTCFFALLTSEFWNGTTCSRSGYLQCILWEAISTNISISRVSMKITHN